MFSAQEPLELAYARDERRCEQQGEIIEEYYLSGITDAATGYSPQNTEWPYLDGYFAELRRRVISGDRLEINWLSETPNGSGEPELIEF